MIYQTQPSDPRAKYFGAPFTPTYVLYSLLAKHFGVPCTPNVPYVAKTLAC